MNADLVALPPLNLWRKTRNSLGLGWAFARVPLWLAIPRRATLARVVEQRFFKRLLRSLGIKVRLSGDAVREPGTLFVVNHVSWADIPVLASVLDAAFVAKAEAGNWPLIGALMRRYGVVLVDRNSKGTSALQVDAITCRLLAGQSVIIFPEGTTSVGEAILPFRTSLLQSAWSAQQVQPVVLRYLDGSGAALSPTRQRAVAWIDDDTLAEGVARIAREPVLAALDFLEPVDPQCLTSRKQLAEHLHGVMSAAYAAMPSRSR